MNPMKLGDLASLPTVVNIVTAAKALGLSRGFAYELARRDEFPCRIIRIGGCYRVPTAELLSVLGAERSSSGSSDLP